MHALALTKPNSVGKLRSHQFVSHIIALSVRRSSQTRIPKALNVDRYGNGVYMRSSSLDAKEHNDCTASSRLVWVPLHNTYTTPRFHEVRSLIPSGCIFLIQLQCNSNLSRAGGKIKLNHPLAVGSYFRLY